MKVRLLRYGRNILGETRTADFLRAFGRPVETTRIVSFGRCNFHCPYCKRDGQFTDGNGNIVRSVEVDIEEVKDLLRRPIENGERVRLSGGDPVMFPLASLEIAKWVYSEYGKKISIAHNGSSLKFAQMLVDYLDYAAIDLKAATPKEFALRAGLSSEEIGEKMLRSALKVQDFLSSSGVLVDIRTPVFGDTTYDDLARMAEMIFEGGDNSREFWTLRAYRKVRGCDFKIPVLETLYEWAELLSNEFPGLPIGIRKYWKGRKSFVIFKAGKKI